MITFPMFGRRHVAETHVGALDAIGYAIDVGNGRVIRQPASQKGMFDKLATGEPVQLSSGDCDFFNRVGVELADVSTEVREKKALASHAAGVPVDIVNATTAMDRNPHYRAAHPIRFVTAFKAL